jgi:N-acetyltransferase 10
MLSKASVKARPNVLWCYNKDLGFTSHRGNRSRQIQKEAKRGSRENEEMTPFELFLSTTDVKYAYYRETHKVLGNTFGMCVLQDFEALTPNLLARTVETVEGGGIVVLLIRTLTSLRQLYTMTMDVHARFRTDAHHDVVGRFNERFLLSLGVCKSCLILDDELNILPLSSHARSIKRVEMPAGSSVDDKGNAFQSESAQELSDLQTSMKDTQPAGALVDACRTLDQARAVLTFAEAIAEKTLRSTVVMTAARGRGKSAALGISVAGAVAYGYANIFVTAPSPENLRTFFEMVLKGFDALGYKEHFDYEVVQSTNAALNNAVVRINVFKSTHRQTVQYVPPDESYRLSQAELLVIDEAGK